MRQVLFLQGAGEGAHAADAALVASLRRALGPAYDVAYPRLPDEADPSADTWLPAIGRALAALREPLVVAHSLGGSLLLSYLAQSTAPIAALFLVAVPFWGGDGWRYEGYERLQLPADLGARLPPVTLYHGDADATVPFAHLALYAALLPQATIRPLPGADHQLGDDLRVVARDLAALG